MITDRNVGVLSRQPAHQRIAVSGDPNRCESSAPTRHRYRARQLLLQELIPRLPSATRAFTDSLAQCCRGPGDVGNADRLADGLGTALDDAQRLIRSMKPTKRSPPPTHRLRVERLRLQPGSRATWARMERLAASPAARALVMPLMTELDVRAVLPTIRVPTLVVHHAENALIPPAKGRYIAEHIPDAKYVELPGRNWYHQVEPGWRESFQEVAEFLTGEQTDVADDRVLATVLFTDIVDSTRRAAQIGDRDWHALLDAHDAVVRSQLARFRGREVNTSGDGFLAMFDGPQRAIRCAMSIRDAVQALGIEVRAGLHTGECEVRGDDIGGIAVHIGARVSALAGPNDVLVSSTLRDLVIGSGLEFDDRGTHELKGVPGEWRLFAVATP